MGRVAEHETAPRAPALRGRGDAPLPDKLGRYQVLFELARGGMGTVYVARLSAGHGFDRVVAVKRLHAEGATDDDTAAFLAEARLTAALTHPNVVQTLDLGEHDGAPFLVMQLVEGVSLARLLRRLGERDERLDPHLAAWIVAQAATGLHAAHELRGPDGTPYGIVHRDVSPENVLLSYDGRVHVADFGVAKYAGADRATQSGVVKGKFAYMSPEQTRAQVIDRRSDVFSLGIVLHEALTGQRLFAGASPADTIRRIVDEVAPDPRVLRPDVPEALAVIAARCLAKSPDERFPTAVAVADELRRFARDAIRASAGAREPVDEADLAGLLGELFVEERADLRARLQRTGGASAPAPAEPSAVVGTSEPHGSVTATVGSSFLPKRARWPWWVGVATLGIAAAVFVWRVREPATAADPVAVPSAFGAASAPSTVPLDPPPPPPPASVAAPSATPRATAAAPAARAAPPKARPSAAAEPPAPAATASASHRGEPFRDL